MRIVLLLTGFCYFLCFNSVAQVRDVRSNIEKDKSERKSGYSNVPREKRSDSFSPPDISEGLGAFLAGSLFYYTIYGVFYGLDQAQYAMQLRRFDHPETFSLQGELSAGFDIQNNGFLSLPSVRGNWGLFSSHLSFRQIHDVTGNLQSLDWQVLKLRMPLKNLKLEYGLGFSHVFSPSRTYFEQSAGFEWCLLNRKLTLQGEHLWSLKTNLEHRFRKETSVNADYEVGRTGDLRLCPAVGYTFQEYFGSTRFHFFKMGLIVRLF
jgi:hypothetical protein